MIRYLPFLIAYAALLTALYGCLEATKSNGATDQPLLVDEPHPITPSSEAASTVPWRLLTICPINQQNVPRYRKVET